MHASILLLACWLAVPPADSDSVPETGEPSAEFREVAPLRPIPANQVRLEPIRSPDSSTGISTAETPADASPDRANSPDIVTHLAAPIVVRPKSPQWTPAPPATISSESIPGQAMSAPAAKQVFDSPRPSASVNRPANPTIGQPLREESLSPAQRVGGLPPPRELGTLIRPVNFQQTDATGGVTTRTTSGLLLQTAMLPPDDPEWALGGQPTSLAATIDRVTDRAQRLAIIRSYWRTHSDICAYNWAVEEGAFIAGVSPTPQPSDQSLLMAARLESQAHLQRTRLSATASQVDLAEVSRFAARAVPLPGDTPLVTAYQTKFDKIFANRTPPAGLRRVAVSIPLQKQLLDTTAEAVASATDAVRELNDEYQRGQTSLLSLLDAHRRLRKQRLEFLDSVRTYNELVADYAVALGGSVNTETLVSMLIPVSAAARTAQATRMESTRMEPTTTTAGDFRDPRDASRSLPNVPATGGAVRGAGGVGTPAGGFAPGGTSAPAGSSRPGNWMSPRTTIRDGAVQGSASVAPSLNSAPPNWSGAPRRETAAANRPNATYPASASPSFDGDPAPRFTPPPSSPAPATMSSQNGMARPRPTAPISQPNAMNASPAALNAAPAARAIPGDGGFRPPAGGFIPPDRTPPPADSAPSEIPPDSYDPAGAPPAPEAPVSIPPADAPPSVQPAETFDAPGGGFVPPPDGFVPPNPGAQLGTPQ